MHLDRIHLPIPSYLPSALVPLIVASCPAPTGQACVFSLAPGEVPLACDGVFFDERFVPVFRIMF